MDFWDIMEQVAPWLGIGVAGLNQYNQSQSRDNYIAALQQQEQEKFDQANKVREAYGQYQDQIAGLYGGYADAVAGGNAAQLAAFQESDAARLKQSKKARKRLKKGRKRGLKYLQPYRAAGQAMLPMHMKAASQGFKGLDLLNAYLQTPEQMAKLNQSGPAIELGAKGPIGGNLPSWMTGRK